MRDALIEVGTQVVFELLMLVIGIGFAYLSRLLGKSKKMEHTAAAVSELERVVQTIVGDLQQTIVEGLKDASVDGKLSEEEIFDLGRILIQKTEEQISDAAVDTLEAAGVDFESMVHSIAESYIAKIKRETFYIPVSEEVREAED